LKIRLITIGHKAPSWIQEGYQDYAKRLPASCALELIEIPAEKRPEEKMLTSIKPDNYVIALDVKGKYWSTEDLSTKLSGWLQSGQNIDLLIGGADGLTPDCLAKAQEKWSLSPLTFPHMLVRVIVAEQIYRAYSILQGHPYHR
jgi:23S rRNA (pseudouridine1915-N3)-methyltransferase